MKLYDALHRDYPVLRSDEILEGLENARETIAVFLQNILRENGWGSDTTVKWDCEMRGCETFRVENVRDRTPDGYSAIKGILKNHVEFKTATHTKRLGYDGMPIIIVQHTAVRDNWLDPALNVPARAREKCARQRAWNARLRAWCVFIDAVGFLALGSALVW